MCPSNVIPMVSLSLESQVKLSSISSAALRDCSGRVEKPLRQSRLCVVPLILLLSVELKIFEI